MIKGFLTLRLILNILSEEKSRKKVTNGKGLFVNIEKGMSAIKKKPT